MMPPVFRAKDAATAHAMCHVACDMLRECRPKAADVAEEAEPDASPTWSSRRRIGRGCARTTFRSGPTER